VVDVIGMFGAGTGGLENAIAMIDIPSDGFLIGVDWDLTCDLDADAEICEAELSFIATTQISTNDVRGRISSISANAGVLSAVGVSATSIQKWLSNFDLSVAGGERLFLHINATAGVTSRLRCNLFLDQPGSTRRSARRR